MRKLQSHLHESGQRGPGPSGDPVAPGRCVRKNKGDSLLAKVNDAEIFFDIEGAGLVPDGEVMKQRDVCFVLHGGPCMDHTYFKPYLSPLAADVQLIYVDHRGTGRSDHNVDYNT